MNSNTGRRSHTVLMAIEHSWRHHQQLTCPMVVT